MECGNISFHWFLLEILFGEKDANYMSVSQQNDRKSGLQNSLNCGKAFLCSLKIKRYSNKII